MSNERSPRAVCSTTIGTRGIASSSGSGGKVQPDSCTLSDLQPRGCASSGGSGDFFVYVQGIAHNTEEEAPMTDQIERELLIPAEPEDVWEVVTGPGFLA